MGLVNKIKWILGILVVFILIIATNLIDKNNFIRVRDSVVTIYEDRLVGKDLLFQISKSIHEKEVAVALSDSVFFSNRNKKVDNNIQDLVTSFEQTNLTREKKKVFRDLKENLESISNSETAFIQSRLVQKTTLINDISSVKENLNELSKIQLREGRVQMSISKKAIDTVELFTQIEIYILIFLAIIIQIIVIYKPKEK
ncbi:MAG: hypothetical protein ACI9M9_001766 [Flavobacteriaceae bacterium]|jgi:hypothetical protein